MAWHRTSARPVFAAPPGRDGHAESERAVVARVRAGDPGAFEGIFREYYRALCEFACGYVRSPERAEEVVQDVLGAVWAGRAEWKVRDSVRAYLFGAVRNRALNVVARERTARVFEEREQAGAGGDVADSRGDAQAGLERAETFDALERAIAALPEGRRAVLTLRVWQQMSYAEIAAALGTTVKNVEVQLRRAVVALRVALPNYLR